MPRIRINRNFESIISKYEKPFKNQKFQQASLHFSKLSKHKSFLSLKNTFFFRNCWIVIDILNLLCETKINYWFKHLLSCNISAILVAIIKLINI